ncbi:MAG: ABC transporter ATP-binding protein [Pseudomonadota bacterium]
MSSSNASKEIAISVKDVGKIYRLGVKEEKHKDIASSVGSALKSPIKNFKKYRSLYKFSDEELSNINDENTPADILWALRDVSFEIPQGQVVGIVGKNGAGKSTLLKLLTKITPPTFGEMRIKGRVASLLEVGTGFHPELTGRENVYLNSTILGMRKHEVDQKFDEIVEFSGVSKFLDTPVKRYSSGMRVRLAFSVAAHLEPEVLIIDEVLAVGDASFQRKCIGKMQDVGREGRTVLFVSHNMPAISSLCDRAIMLESGRLTMDGAVHDVLEAYLKQGSDETSSIVFDDPSKRPGKDIAQLCSLRVTTVDGKPIESISSDEPVRVAMEYEVLEGGHKLLCQLHFHNDEDVHLFNTLDSDPEWYNKERPAGRYTSSVVIPANSLAPGRIFISTVLVSRTPDRGQFYERYMISFIVTDAMGEGTARRDWPGKYGGVVRPIYPWNTEAELKE